MRHQHNLPLPTADESAAQLTPKQLGRLNKELSSLQPVVDALRVLSKQRQEVRHGTLLSAIWLLSACPFPQVHFAFHHMSSSPFCACSFAF